jgi:hypothetical protein
MMLMSEVRFHSCMLHVVHLRAAPGVLLACLFAGLHLLALLLLALCAAHRGLRVCPALCLKAAVCGLL